jgi:magnesium chelatase family protein
MSKEEALDVTRIHSIAGLIGAQQGLIQDRPFRAPHHNVSAAGLIGGGPGLARPGEVVLANHGVLFTDELPLFRRDVLESLRAPLEDGVVRIARRGGVVSFPCRFSLVAAMNPCPCGYLEELDRSCRCSGHVLRSYTARLSGPLLDRFDIQVPMTRLNGDELLRPQDCEPSSVIRERVEAAREVQRRRYGSPVATNASVSNRQLRLGGRFRSEAFPQLQSHIDSGSLTGRGFERVLRLARTIADLLQSEEVGREHVVRALAFRVEDELEMVPA